LSLIHAISVQVLAKGNALNMKEQIKQAKGRGEQV